MVLEIVLPIFAIVLVGFIAAKAEILDERANNGLFRYVLYMAIPCLLFEKMSSIDLPHGIPWTLLCGYYVGTLASFAIGAAVARQALSRTLEEQGMMGFSTSYSNMALLGIPLVLTAFGDSAAVPLFTIIALHPTLLVPLTALFVELGQNRHEEIRLLPFQAIAGVLRNPIIIGLLAGLLANVLDIALMPAAESVIFSVGATAGTCALVSVGASLSQYKLTGTLSAAAIMVALKNFMHPLIVWSLTTHVFEIEPLWRNTAVVLAALPTGVNVYILARHYNVMAEDAAKTITMSTLTSTVTVTVLLSWLLGTP